MLVSSWLLDWLYILGKFGYISWKCDMSALIAGFSTSRIHAYATAAIDMLQFRLFKPLEPC